MVGTPLPPPQHLGGSCSNEGKYAGCDSTCMRLKFGHFKATYTNAVNVVSVIGKIRVKVKRTRKYGHGNLSECLCPSERN